jgi:hypothetical protein
MGYKSIGQHCYQFTSAGEYFEKEDELAYDQ